MRYADAVAREADVIPARAQGMDGRGRVNEVPRFEPRASAAPPVANYLVELHARIAALTGGRPADYIPELGKADPSRFGIALATVDGTETAGERSSPIPAGSP